MQLVSSVPVRGYSLNDVSLCAHSAGLIRQQYTYQRIVNFKVPVVIDETHLAKLVHKVAHA
jgi:hypothetical protein